MECITGLIKAFLIIIGSTSLLLGIMGLFLPILPTTPFLLLSAFCFSKSSDNLYRKLLGNKYFGSYIRDYQEGKGIPKRVKTFALITLWTAIGFSIFFLIDSILFKSLLIIVATAVTIHILSVKTKKD